VNFSLYRRRTFNKLTYERILLLKFPKKSLSTATPGYVNGDFPVIERASRREGFSRSSPATDQSVASFSSHIRKQFRTVGIFDSDVHRRRSVAR
jgi:hypothetical protein